ncbi:unnamed protein product [Boreogadus saida]
MRSSSLHSPGLHNQASSHRPSLHTPPHPSLHTPASTPQPPHPSLHTTASTPQPPYPSLHTTASTPQPPHPSLHRRSLHRPSTINTTPASTPQPPHHSLHTTASLTLATEAPAWARVIRGWVRCCPFPPPSPSRPSLVRDRGASHIQGHRHCQPPNMANECMSDYQG